MDNLSNLVEKPQPEVSIDEEKLRFFFISKIPIWDHFSLTEHAYKSSSVGEKTSFLNRYYRELYQKYYGLGNLFLFILSVCLLLFLSFCLYLATFLDCVLKKFFRAIGK